MVKGDVGGGWGEAAGAAWGEGARGEAGDADTPGPALPAPLAPPVGDVRLNEPPPS